MGLFSGGNSSSRTTNLYENTVSNSNFSELGGGQASNIQGSNNAVTFLDGGAISNSFTFADRALSFAENAARDSNNFAESTALASNNIARQVTENAGRQTQEAVKAVTESVRSGARDVVDQAGTIAGFSLAAWVLVKIFSRSA
jgi:hypothetical protein